MVRYPEMGRLSWILWVGPVPSSGALHVGGRRAREREERKEREREI